MSNFRGFVVSDDHFNGSGFFLGRNVYKYSQIAHTEKIVIGVGKKTSSELKNSIGEGKNLLYLWKD
jgi:hypothetical protein